MAKLVLLRPVHFPPGREEEGLSWLSEAMIARENAGMLFHAIVRSRTDRRDYVAVMIWPDQATYEGWHRSEERERLFEDQPNYLVREPTRRYTLLEPDGEATTSL